MISISLCMIVKDEEEVLARCLDSVRNVVDEVIIVDTGSADKTRDIAFSYTGLVYDFPWVDDFAAARNFSFSKATKDYILWLDADDVLLEKDRLALEELKSSLNPAVDLVMMRYDAACDQKGQPTFSYYRERLLRRSRHYEWEGAVHEAISPSGNILYSDIAVTHKKVRRSDPRRNLRIFQKQLAEGKRLQPRDQYYYARELYYNGLYLRAIRELLDFLDSGRGWRENCVSACQDLAACYYRVGEETMALCALLRSFQFDNPRAEVCCDLGQHFYEREQYRQAIYWYEMARTMTPDPTGGGFCRPDCYGFIPDLQLCMCHFKLGELQKAEHYNQLAEQLKPEDQTVLHNKTYFESLRTT